MLPRELIMNDINRFVQGIKDLYEVDSCEVYHCANGLENTEEIGWRITKEDKEYVIASTYSVDSNNGMRQNREPKPMKVFEVVEREGLLGRAKEMVKLGRYRNIGESMVSLGVKRRETA